MCSLRVLNVLSQYASADPKGTPLRAPGPEGAPHGLLVGLATRRCEKCGVEVYPTVLGPGRIETELSPTSQKRFGHGWTRIHTEKTYRRLSVFSHNVLRRREQGPWQIPPLQEFRVLPRPLKHIPGSRAPQVRCYYGSKVYSRVPSGTSVGALPAVTGVSAAGASPSAKIWR